MQLGERKTKKVLSGMLARILAVATGRHGRVGAYSAAQGIA